MLEKAERNADGKLKCMIARGYRRFGTQALTNGTSGRGLLGGSLSSQNREHVSPQNGKLEATGQDLQE